MVYSIYIITQFLTLLTLTDAISIYYRHVDLFCIFELFGDKTQSSPVNSFIYQGKTINSNSLSFIVKQINYLMNSKFYFNILIIALVNTYIKVVKSWIKCCAMSAHSADFDRWLKSKCAKYLIKWRHNGSYITSNSAPANV